jgi:hypothetical protein
MYVCVLLLLLLSLYRVAASMSDTCSQTSHSFLDRFIFRLMSSHCVCISSLSGRLEHGLAWSCVGRRTASATSPGSAMGTAPVAQRP